jgi:hypothetical protein
MTIDLIAAFRGCRLTFSYYCSQLLMYCSLHGDMHGSYYPQSYSHRQLMNFLDYQH